MHHVLKDEQNAKGGFSKSIDYINDVNVVNHKWPYSDTFEH